ncbi:Phenylalanine-4-hydroxylase [Tritonibacter multivorans]|uniref:Phenylalanine-4-hydroxylase n=1 Tax=Tritonibacter multivorans TaxID=928856 RepID=A0A0P1GLX0_9RHOB|nr:phenylalanine 4-monooxygenase [Tritonibacter multivorans]MDA7419295.1 phenylalanine 4-monooxygenase [Tritonibacter multivorans]CUH75173.1 Phenylalanine-4-hydroxylase [Tritonibacter multivorans]SFD23289.1 Phenylalanine 4-hydroxylase [Tritonibacter multivorans]
MPKSTDYVAKIPDDTGHIAYTSEEDAVWADLYAQQLPRIREHASKPYLDGFDRVAMAADRVPQCPEISDRLRTLTGWQVAPVPALIGFQQFFSMLAEKTFPAASFIRSREHFDYIEEPDIFHEIFGHTPLLTDARFAGFSQAIGTAGTQAVKDDYAWLIRLYWFTIEFGLLREGDSVKTLGSGLASSPTEILHATSGVPELRPFDVIDILRTPYRIDIPQPVYFVLDDLDQLFAAADRDLLGDIQTARALGLHAPKYPPKAA